MKKIRILAAVLAVLMLPLALLFGCGETVTDPCADGHNYPNKWERIQRRSCTDDEVEQRACKTCGWIEQQVKNAATGHVFDPANKISANDATCTTDGHYITECTWCDEVEITDYPGSALGHKFVHYVSQEDGYSELAYCINCNAGTDEKLLGIKLDFEGEKTHLSYTALSTFTGGNADLATYVTSNGSTALKVARPEGGVIGSSAYGVVLSPRTDILDNVQYVIEAEIVLAGAKGNVTVTGNKAYGGQSMDFVTYDYAKKEIQVVGGPAYAVKDADLNGIKIAVVTNDSKSMYDLYVNNVLVAGSVEYIDDFYKGFGIGTFEIKMAEGDYASEIIVDNVLLYNAAKPNGWDGASAENYDYYTTKTGENIVTPKLDAECDHVFSYVTVTTDCSATSYIKKVCSVCNGAAVTKETGISAHKWAFSHATNASCWAPAYECNVCTVCGLKDGTITAPKLSHELGDEKTVVEPTCTDIGYSEGNCRNCGYFFYDKSSEVPALGHEVGADATVVVPDCVTKGYTEGPCIRCGKTYKPAELEKPALGHTCFAPVIYPASCSAAGYTQNTCDACGLEYKTNEIATTGHTNFSRVVGETIETMCVECGHSTVLNLVKVQPTAQEQIDYINANGFLNLEASLDSGFSSGGSLTSIGSYAAVTRGNGKIQPVPRYSYWTVVDDAIRPGNKYWSVEYAPQNFQGSDSVHSYMNVWNNKYSSHKGERYIFEFSIKPNQFVFAEMTVQALERLTASPYSVTGLSIGQDGTVKSMGAVCGKIDVTNPNVWTRIAMVVDCSEAHTVEVYFNGVLVSSAPIDNKATSFPYVQEWRVNLGPQNKNATESYGYCLDEVFSYNCKDPLYITGLNRYDGTLTNFTEAANDEAAGYLLEIGASKLGYSGKEVWKVESMTDTFYGQTEASTKNVVKFVKGAEGKPAIESSSAAQKQDGAITATDNRATTGSWTNINVKFPKVDGVKIDVMAAERAYTLSGEDNIVSTDDPETEEIEPTVYKRELCQDVFLTLDNGKLLTPDGRVVCDVEANKWYNISFITKDQGASIAYEVYVNGMLYRSGLELVLTTPASATLSGAYTLFMLPHTDCEYILADLAVYGNVSVPDTYVGKLEAEYEIPKDDITIFSVDANTDVKSFIDWNDNSVGNKLNSIKTYEVDAFEEVVNEETGETETVTVKKEQSYLEITDAANEGIYAGYQLAQVGLDRVIGADAKDPKWTVKITDFATNGANYVFPMYSFDGIKVNEDGTYDFSVYSKVIVRMFVEETNKGNIQIRFRSATGEDGKANYAYAQWAVSQYGWVTFEADLATLTAYNNPDLSKVVEVYIDTDAKDGSTFYLESVKIAQFGQVIPDSGYVAPEAPCEEHAFVKGTPVSSNCADQGYTIYTCSECGVKKVDDFTPALGHKYVAGETTEVVAATCEVNGVKVTANTCSVCQDVMYTNVVTEATGHKWTKKADGVAKTCLENGYDVMVCANANCDHAELECRYVLVATGHVAVPTSIKVVAPDCVNDGYTSAKCSACNEEYKYDIVPAIGHRITEVKRDLAQCEIPGMIYNSCSNPGCTESANVEIPAKVHVYEESSRVPASNGVDGKITMTCINGCGKSYDVVITAFPTAADMAAKNPVFTMNGENKNFTVGSFAGVGVGEGITANFAKWSVTSDAANGSYINVVVAPDAGEVASNVVFNAAGAKSIEFNVMPNGEAFADVRVDVEINGTVKTLVTIANTGWVSVNGLPTYQIDVAEASWTRIAIVACDDKTIDVYVNGQYARSIWLDTDAVFGNTAIAVGEGSKSDAGLYIDEIYALGELSFAAEGNLEFDDHRIEMDAKYFNNAQGYLTPGKGNTWADGIFKKTNLVYKANYALTLDSVTDTFYGEEAESTKDVLHLKKSTKTATYTSGSTSAKDSYIDIGDFMLDYKATTVQFSMTLKFNVMQDITLVNGRRSGSATGWANAYLTMHKNGDIKWLGTKVASFKQGEWVKIDVYMFATGTYECALFINDEFVAYNDGSHSKITQQYKDNTKDSIYRTLNVGGNDNEHDIYISDWDVNVDVKFPEIPQA